VKCPETNESEGKNHGGEEPLIKTQSEKRNVSRQPFKELEKGTVSPEHDETE